MPVTQFLNNSKALLTFQLEDFKALSNKTWNDQLENHIYILESEKLWDYIHLKHPEPTYSSPIFPACSNIVTSKMHPHACIRNAVLAHLDAEVLSLSQVAYTSPPALQASQLCRLQRPHKLSLLPCGYTGHKRTPEGNSTNHVSLIKSLIKTFLIPLHFAL